MAIQILGLRGKGHSFFEKEWRAPSVPYLFKHAKEISAAIPDADRWNIYFTVHDCAGKEARDFTYQEILPFDIDKIDINKAEEVAKVACATIGVDFNKTGILMSGHGVQLFVQIEQPIDDAKYFVENRELYRFIVSNIKSKLKEAGLEGTPDPSVFSMRRLMRMPLTVNRKPDLPDVESYIIQSHIELQGFNLQTACGAPTLGKSDAIDREVWRKMSRPDTETVQKECRFLEYARKNQAALTEPEWYAAMGIVGFLDRGKDLAHEYSKEYSGYSEQETNFKFEMATKTTGPRTCKSVDAIWGGCNKCPHAGKITTPCQLKSEDFIATEGTGFYDTYLTPQGQVKRNPNYEDLVRYYKRTRGKFFSPTRGVFYTYSTEKKHWEVTDETEIKNFAYTKFDPSPRSGTVNEFLGTMAHTEYRSVDWMPGTTTRKLNLQNGVLDLGTGRLHAHSDNYGFMSILPYAYDENARCPKFDKFLKEVSCGDEDIVRVLWEFMGYAISGDECYIHKALILLGKGSNGKSTFNKVLKALVGPGYYSTLNMKALQNDQNRAMLEGKLFNIGDENSPVGMVDADIFKVLTSGEHYTLKEVFKRPLSVRNKTKLIFNCNELPKNYDTTHGYYRRLLLVPFRATFNENDANFDPDIEYKLYDELPGILTKCISFYHDLTTRKRFIEPDVARRMITSMIEEQDELSQWFEENVILDEGRFVTNHEAYGSYMQFCERDDVRPKNKISFSMALAERKVHKERRVIDGVKHTVYVGIQIRKGF